jgi:DNA-binding SARP family transcriptional activator
VLFQGARGVAAPTLGSVGQAVGMGGPPMPTHPASMLATLRQAGDTAILHLFAGPYLTMSGRRVDIPEGSKRLLVFVALNGGRADRRHAAGTLWPSGDDLRAAGNLRSALWRLKGAGIDILTADKHTLELNPEITVDVNALCAWATRVIDGSASMSDLCDFHWRPDLVELLPGWYDDWALFERERIRQRLLHALEALTGHLVAAGRIAEAVEAAMVAVAVEPLRESAQRALIQAHLAEGNVVEGWRTYESYRDLVQRELGIEPGASILALLQREGGHGDAAIWVPRTASPPGTQLQRQGRANEKNGYRVQAITLVVALLGILGSMLSGAVDDYFQDFRRSLMAEQGQSDQMFVGVPNELADGMVWNAAIALQRGAISLPGHQCELTATSGEFSLAINADGSLL